MAIRTIELILHGNAGQAIGEMEHLAEATSATADTMHAKISNMAAKVTMATAAAGIGIAAVSVKLAEDFEKAHANLETAVKNSGASLQQLNPILDEQTPKFAKLGYNQTEYQAALARGVIGTGNAQKALALMGHAADLAAFSHTDLTTAMTALVKVTEGKLRPAAQLGIDLSALQASSAKQLQTAQEKVTKAQEAAALVQEHINSGSLTGQAATDQARKAYENLSTAMGELQTKSDGAQNALDAINKITGGAAQNQAETFSGKIKGLQATLENIGIKIGLAIIPVIEQLAGAMEDVINWFEKNKTAAEALGIAVGTVLAGALAIFTYDKAVAFIAGLGRIGTALGLMGTEAEVAGGQMSLFAGAEGGGGVAATLGPMALAVIAIGGIAYGLSQLFPPSDALTLKLGNLATETVPQLSARFDEFAGKIQHAHDNISAFDQGLPSVTQNLKATKQEHADFNQILDKTPQYAQKFIDAIVQSGQDASWFAQQLDKHNISAEAAKVATQRFGIEAQIADAKARGDAASVYGLNLQLAALPTNPQIEVAVQTGGAVNALADLTGRLERITESNWEVAVGITGLGVFGPA